MPKPTRTPRLILSLVLFISIVTLACRVTSPVSSPSSITVPTPVAVQVISTPVTEQVSTAASQDQVLVDLYARINPSVVNITVYLNQNGQVIPLAQASGFVYDDQGHIITNAHVVHGADVIEVTFSDGLVRTATPVGEDLFGDLAVVHVDLPEGITPLTLGTMDNLAVGQSVVAIGNPFGFEGTLTSGIVSALGRTIPTLMTLYSIPQAIQTDAAINPGNSGGPLLSLQGKVVGVVNQIETSGTSNSNLGVGFAIPVSIVRRVVPALIEDGHYDWSWLGVKGYTVTPSMVKAMSLPVERGAYISTVTEGGPAQSAGLRGTTETITQDGRSVEVGGDVITAIDSQPVNTFDDMLVYLSLQTSPGQDVTLTILRDGQYQDVTVTLGTRPSQ
jgi:S1-C subfamily serine protease